MNIQIASTVEISLFPRVPQIVQSCLIRPPTRPRPPDEDIWVPVNPGTNPDDIPDAPEIFDTSPSQIIGCIISTEGDAQTRLSGLFPDASNSQGVIERRNNDIWVFDGAFWNNVGPNPGKIIVVDRTLPVWNQKVFLEAITKTLLRVLSLPYSFSGLTEALVITRTKLNALNALPPNTIVPAIYTQSSVYGSMSPATFTGMTNGIFEETLETGTNNITAREWVKLDMNSLFRIGSIYIGSDFDDTLISSYGKEYTENCNVYGSVDDESYELLFNTGTFDAGIQRYIVDTIARYIKIEANSTFGYLAVTEFYAKTIGPASVQVDFKEVNLGSIAPTIDDSSVTKTSIVSVEIGSSAPVLGVSQATISTAEGLGWTLLYNATADEDSILTELFGFDFRLNGVNYANCFVNSNSYVTFGAEDNKYLGLSASMPPVPKIHIGSGDFSCQRVYAKRDLVSYSIRWEGNSNYAASAGSSNRFVEIRFFKKLEDGTQLIDIRSGNISGDTSGPFMIATENTALATITFIANGNWVFTGNENGTSWTIQSGKYVQYTSALNINVPSNGIDVEQSTPAVVGSGIQIPDSVFDITPLEPSISTGFSAAVQELNVSMQLLAPDSVGYLVALKPGTYELAVESQNPTVSTTTLIAATAPNTNLTILAPALATGVSIATQEAGIITATESPTIATAQTDPNFASVSLLLHMDGSNGSSTFTDSSSAARTITRFGNAQISTAQSKFGGASALFDGSGDYLTTAYSTTAFDWWTSDFTIEAWVYATSWSGWARTGATQIPCMIGNMSATTSTAYWSFGPNNNGKLTFYYFNGFAGIAITTTASLPTNEWVHISATKTSSGVTLYVNETSGSTTAISGTPQSSASFPLTIGQHQNISVNGHIDDLRITKGVARTIVVPTAPFPDA